MRNDNILNTEKASNILLWLFHYIDTVTGPAARLV